MHFIEEMTYEQIAKELNIKLSTVHYKMKKFKKHAKSFKEKNYEK